VPTGWLPDGLRVASGWLEGSLQMTDGVPPPGSFPIAGTAPEIPFPADTREPRQAVRGRSGRWIVPDTQVAEEKGCILHSPFCLLLPLLPSPPRFRRPPLHLCDLSKTTKRSALPVDLAAQGRPRMLMLPGAALSPMCVLPQLGRKVSPKWAQWRRPPLPGGL